MGFAVRSAIDFLPTLNNLQTLRSDLTLLVNYALIKILSCTSAIY